jgi:two-component system alkaline phosphatase synthesis response regulator PhoP
MNERISVLIVEDEEHIRDVLEYNLKFDGFEVHLAANGRDALEIARTVQIDVVLLDWMMPDMDGLKVLYELRQDPKTQNIPVFMLTSKASVADIDQALHAGASDYITKPFDPMLLGRIIKRKLLKCPNPSPVG